MKIGVNLINFGPSASPDSLTRWAQIVEGLGFHLLMTSDHVAVTPDVSARYPAPFYEPVSTLGWLAGVTSRIEIGSTVIILPYRNPLETARAFAAIDRLSGGRLILGVGVGWAEQEFAALGVPFNRRGAITDEYLAALKLLWTEELASFEGEYVSFRDVDTAPRPLQLPHPPIWVGGGSEAAQRRAIRFGDAWHPLRIRPGWIESEGKPHLAELAEAEGKPAPPICPRIRLDVKALAMPDDERLVGEGTIDQIRGDLAALEAAGCPYVLLDTFTGDVEATRRTDTAWRMLAEVAEKALDLAGETVR